MYRGFCVKRCILSPTTDTIRILWSRRGWRSPKRLQVWYEDAAETAVPDRELACFRKLRDEDAQAESILITNDYEDVIAAVATTVRCVPLVKFLLFR